MTLKKPDLHILTVWRLRLLAAALVPSFLTAWFSPRINWLWWLFTAAWMCAFLYFYIFYYPIKYRKLAYGVNAHCLLVYCGVIYTRVKAVPFTSIQYTSVFSTPLERLFGVTSLFVYAAGGRVYIPGLAPQDARELQALLTPGRPHSAAQEGGAGDV